MLSYFPYYNYYKMCISIDPESRTVRFLYTCEGQVENAEAQKRKWEEKPPISVECRTDAWLCLIAKGDYLQVIWELRNDTSDSCEH